MQGVSPEALLAGWIHCPGMLRCCCCLLFYTGQDSALLLLLFGQYRAGETSHSLLGSFKSKPIIVVVDLTTPYQFSFSYSFHDWAPLYSETTAHPVMTPKPQRCCLLPSINTAD